MSTKTERQVGWKNIVAWGSGDVFGSGAATIIGLWMLFFYTQVAGLTPVAAGAIFAITKVWDAITDPIVAYISDNVRTRWGRRKVFFLIGAPLALEFGLMFVAGFGWWYYLITYMTFSLISTILMTPYSTLPAEMTTDYNIRTKMGSARMMFAQITAFVVTAIPGLILSRIADQATAFMVMGFTFGALFMIPWIFVYRYTWEREDLPPVQSRGSFKRTMVDLYKEMFSTFRIRSFRLHLMMYIGGSVALDIFGSMFMHYMIFVDGVTPAVAGSALSAMTFMQFIGVSVFTWIALKIGNPNAYKCALGVLAAALAYFALLPQWGASQAMPLIIGAVIIGLARGGIYLIPWVVFNFMADVDEALTARRREGILSGMMTLSRKMCAATAMLFSSSALQFFGFVAKAPTQSAETVEGIYLTFLIGPVVLGIMGFIGASRLKLTKETHTELVDEVKRLKEGGRKETVSERARANIESLTGWSYDHIHAAHQKA